ncbi:DNA-binding HxlR family transcriptional regulator [Runella defluvii]|uniref:DNA-binding HxlR family transcriptional regulator n=1 Tax=Runella defluvii TaxID=370973 RepID=A0A7W6EN79_9BACT|nr:helix-turn-helix domain-containing protein [Runella defluvii]MBB3836174.1 DNA-binding HxlR family transcriptional regulator [Runella defluvii]
MSQLVTIKKPATCVSDNEVCTASMRAIQDIMDVLGGKWKISIVTCLCFSPRRFSELLKLVDGISGKVLSRELKDLEMNKLISRTVKDTQPISVEYAITEYGNSFKELIQIMAEWGVKHRKEIIGK